MSVNILKVSSTSPKIIGTVRFGTGISVTAETISQSILIPANKLATNSILNISWTMSRQSGTAGTIISYVYINTSSSLVGATLIATTPSLSTTQWIAGCQRDIQKQGTSCVVTNTTFAAFTDLNQQTSLQNTITINNSTDLYLIFSLKNSATDRSQIQKIKVTEYT